LSSSTSGEPYAYWTIAFIVFSSVCVFSAEIVG